ncbi:unnamed protein product [Orchesella dallaii]|uniref:Multidrug and toxin extrusion protein n=1 Tax=Orchesella dallaii TaxID=48710 RepID=A0ABP1QZI5_9HEXA
MDEINLEIMDSSFGQGQPSQNNSCESTSMQLKQNGTEVADVKAMQPQLTEASPLNPLINRETNMSPLKLFLRFFKPLILLFFPSWIFAKFFAHAAIPALADNLIPLFFIGNVPDESALALAGQFTFVGVIVEVIQEGIVNSLFYYVGRNYTINREKSLQAFKICLTLLFLLGSILMIFMLFFTPSFVKLIDTPESIAEATRRFLYTSSFSFPILLVNAALSNYLLITTSSFLILAQISNVIISFLCNFFLFGNQEFSLHWNLEQLGYYKIIQTILSCINNFVFCLIIERLGPFEFIFKVPLIKDLRSNAKDLFHVSWGNFGDSAVRNFFYFVVTLKFMNNLGEDEAGAWNLLNSIVWGLLLIPSYTVANYVKVKIGQQGTKTVIRGVARESLKCLVGWLLVVSTLACVLWPELADFFGKSNERAQELSTKLLYEMGWIFVIFSFNNAMDALFLGVGKTQYVFYQSLITNLVVYFVPWILYLWNVIEASYWLVIGLYIGGMLVDFLLTTYFCFYVWKSIPDNLETVQ